jgi:hypothetical protein
MFDGTRAVIEEQQVILVVYSTAIVTLVTVVPLDHDGTCSHVITSLGRVGFTDLDHGAHVTFTSVL